MPEYRFGDFINGLSCLGLATAAAVLSSTIVKREMIPVQMSWLGTAGTILTAVLFVVGYAERELLRKTKIRRILAFLMLLSVAVLFWCRLLYTVEIQINQKTVVVLVGTHLTPQGFKAERHTNTNSVKALVSIAGPDAIPKLFGKSAEITEGFYFGSYIVVLACYTILVCGLTIADEHK